MPRRYRIKGATTSNTLSGAKTLCQYKSGSGSSGWVTHITVDGNSLSADAIIDVSLVRMHVASTSMTSFTPLLCDPDGAAANGAGGTGATAVWVSSQTDGTLGDELWRRQVSAMSGGGVEVFFPDGVYEFAAGGAVDKGILALYVNTTLAVAHVISFELGIAEVG